MSGGKIRSWGVSNFDTDDLDEMLAVAGAGKIACNQVLYHLRERAIEHSVIPWCRQHGTAVVAYSPFGHNEFPQPRNPAGETLQTIAQAHGASPRQVALGFLTRDAAVFAIPKAANEAHAADNAAAGELVLRMTKWPASKRHFRSARSRAACQCCKLKPGHHGNRSLFGRRNRAYRLPVFGACRAGQ